MEVAFLRGLVCRHRGLQARLGKGGVGVRLVERLGQVGMRGLQEALRRDTGSRREVRGPYGNPGCRHARRRVPVPAVLLRWEKDGLPGPEREPLLRGCADPEGKALPAGAARKREGAAVRSGGRVLCRGP
ncbi:MAG: hypothetical protein QXS68_04185 [Candidatus Methanomethylicaceae archaeon]